MFFVQVFAVVVMAAMMATYPGNTKVVNAPPEELPAKSEPKKPDMNNPAKGGPADRKRRDTSCSSGTSVLTAAEQENATKSHNNARKYAGDGTIISGDETKMEWDDELAGLAQKLVDKCVFEHGEKTTCDNHAVGQNLAFTTASGKSPDYFIQLWNAEKADYTYSGHSCVPDKMCGHYTQVVWSGSTLLGCAQKICDIEYLGNTYTDATLFACNYYPPGNYQGVKPFVSGTAPCTQCDKQLTNNMYKCEDNLCIECDKNTDSDCLCIKEACEDGSTFNSDSCKCEACTTGKCGPLCQFSDTAGVPCSIYAAEPYSFCPSTSVYYGYMNANCKCECEKYI